MRRHLGLLALLALGGCSFFHDGYPDKSCTSNADCFRAQGEICNLVTQACELASDAAPIPDAPPVPDSRPIPDAPPAPDADLTDAAPADAPAVDATGADANLSTDAGA